MTGLTIVGTDTGVGKTFVARALCRSLRRHGRPVVGLKPFETGCDPTAADADALEAEARSGLPLDLRCPFRYRAALAPGMAALSEGQKGGALEAAAIARAAARRRFAIVETAGGILVPLAPPDPVSARGTKSVETNLDLVAALGLPVLLVGRNALGTLNHLALTAQALRRQGLQLAGMVLSRGPAGAAALGDGSRRFNLAFGQAQCRIPHAVELPSSGLAAATTRLERALPLPWL